MIFEAAFIGLFFRHPVLFIVLGLLPELGAITLISLYGFQLVRWAHQ